MSLDPIASKWDMKDDYGRGDMDMGNTLLYDVPLNREKLVLDRSLTWIRLID